jgi:oligopeptide transport system substrate-binding protein
MTRLRSGSILALLIAGLFVSGCSRRESPAAAAVASATLRLGNGSEPEDLDPQVCESLGEYNILTALFEGLTCIDEKTSQAVPGAAERWEVSADGLTYTFHLRPGLVWSNGDPMTAEDFAYTIHRSLSPRLPCENAVLFSAIRNAKAFADGKIDDFSKVGVSALDAQTLRIELEHPCPYLPSLAAHQAWFPVQRATLEKFGAFEKRGTAWTRPGNLVGNGPFVLKEWSPNARIVVVKNPRYWDAAKNRLNSVVFFPNDNIATDESNFQTGQLDITWDLLPDRIEHYKKAAPQLLRIDPLSASIFIRFNLKRPPLDDRRVRRALSLSIDREAISRDVLHGSLPPSFALTPPDTAGYTPQAHVPTDVTEARRLLAEAGYPGGRGFPSLEIQMNADATNTKMFEAVQEMWRRGLGVSVTLATLDLRVWLDNQRTLSYQVSRSRWVGDYDDPSTYLDLFRSDSGNNETGWSDPEYDRLNDEANATADPARRYALLQRAETRLFDEAPIAPLVYGSRTYLIQPYVHGWVPSLLGIHRYQYVWLENERP